MGDGILTAGFDDGAPAVVVSTGVGMDLSKDAITTTLRQVAALARDRRSPWPSSCRWSSPTPDWRWR